MKNCEKHMRFCDCDDETEGVSSMGESMRASCFTKILHDTAEHTSPGYQAYGEIFCSVVRRAGISSDDPMAILSNGIAVLSTQ